MPRRLAAVVGALLATGALVATTMPDAGAQGIGGAGGPRVERVKGVPTQATVTLGGTVVPYKEVTLAAQLPGRVISLAGTEGDSFKEGAVLAELDDKELRAQRQAAFAALRDAEAAMRNAGVQYSRELFAPQRQSPSQMPGMGMPSLFDQFMTRPLGNMMGQGSPPLERSADLYQQGIQIEQSRNAYLRALSQIEQIDAKFRDARSIAPFDGMIVKKFVEVGDTLQPGQPIMTFADTHYLQVQVEVPARLMPGIRDGMWLRAKLDIRNTWVDARVAQIFPMADPERHTVRVKLDLPTSAPAAPGMYAEVMIPDVDAPVRTALVVPTAAIVQRGSLPMVYVAREDSKKELRIVRLGERVDAYHVTVLSGLQQDEYVYIEPELGGAGTWNPPAPPAQPGPPYPGPVPPGY
jgi:multidrug efflux pump subunit AcrA (membrane-fusion protein)